MLLRNSKLVGILRLFAYKKLPRTCFKRLEARVCAGGEIAGDAALPHTAKGKRAQTDLLLKVLRLPVKLCRRCWAADNAKMKHLNGLYSVLVIE